jgi:hypothetical protein
MTTYGKADDNTMTFPELLWHTMTSVEEDGNTMTFVRDDGKRFMFYHDQDCCESCSIEDVCGDLSDLVGSPLVEAEEVSNADDPPPPENAESFTWTFYRFATVKGTVTVCWLGESNGYYSESVSFCEVKH